MQPGIDILLHKHLDWLRGRRVGLVSHMAAVDGRGCTAAQRLREAQGVRLAALLGPEHSFYGARGAGARCRDMRHPDWGLPIYSLYGETRKPTPRMLANLDTLVFDLQDLGVRCYTYVSTLRYTLEAAAEAGREVIVADRPIPLPRTVDGPLTQEECRSFVSLIDAPLSYGMTPGETALWLKARLGLSLELRVAKMAEYRRDAGRGADWPPWAPPSPAMLSWESAMCYAATVCFEGLGAVDAGRATTLPFQLVGAPWTRGEELAEALNARALPGVRFYPHRYDSRPRDPKPRMLDGARMAVVEPHRFRPALTAVTLVRTLMDLYGKRRVWARLSARPDFFDKLFGTRAVREALLDGEAPAAIAARWEPELARYRAEREKALLYEGR